MNPRKQSCFLGRAACVCLDHGLGRCVCCCHGTASFPMPAGGVQSAFPTLQVSGDDPFGIAVTIPWARTLLCRWQCPGNSL